MDETTLAYHTKLHQWYELHRLNQSGDMACLKLPEDGTHLTPQKALEIDLWRREVNRIFVKPKKLEKKELFWRCHMSAPASATKHGNHSDPRRVKSARFFSRQGKGSAVDINMLPTHLAEMSIHYSQERSGVRATQTSVEDLLVKDLLVKGNKQSLHIPQSTQNVKGSDHKVRSHVSIPQGEKDYDVITHADSAQGTVSSHEPVYRKMALVTDRSQSNVLLNVMSIDDCKMALRYRPQRVISTHALEQNESSNDLSSGEDQGVVLPLRVSQGSRVTSVTPGRTTSILSAQRAKHKQLILQGTGMSGHRPQSALLTRAFNTILQEKSLLSPPAHPKEVRFLSGNHYVSRGHHGPHSPHTPHSKHLYNRLNLTLKNKMNNVVNSRWDQMKSRESGSACVQYGSHHTNSGNIVCNRMSLVSS